MMLRIRYRFTGRCRKHPRYHPSAGQAAIKGGCRRCLALWRVWQAGRTLEERITAFEAFEEHYEHMTAMERSA